MVKVFEGTHYFWQSRVTAELSLNLYNQDDCYEIQAFLSAEKNPGIVKENVILDRVYVSYSKVVASMVPSELARFVKIRKENNEKSRLFNIPETHIQEGAKRDYVIELLIGRSVIKVEGEGAKPSIILGQDVQAFRLETREVPESISKAPSAFAHLLSNAEEPLADPIIQSPRLQPMSASVSLPRLTPMGNTIISDGGKARRISTLTEVSSSLDPVSNLTLEVQRAAQRIIQDQAALELKEEPKKNQSNIVHLSEIRTGRSPRNFVNVRGNQEISELSSDYGTIIADNRSIDNYETDYFPNGSGPLQSFSNHHQAVGSQRGSSVSVRQRRESASVISAGESEVSFYDLGDLRTLNFSDPREVKLEITRLLEENLQLKNKVDELSKFRKALYLTSKSNYSLHESEIETYLMQQKLLKSKIKAVESENFELQKNLQVVKKSRKIIWKSAAEKQYRYESEISDLHRTLSNLKEQLEVLRSQSFTGTASASPLPGSEATAVSEKAIADIVKNQLTQFFKEDDNFNRVLKTVGAIDSTITVVQRSINAFGQDLSVVRDSMSSTSNSNRLKDSNYDNGSRGTALSESSFTDAIIADMKSSIFEINKKLEREMSKRNEQMQAISKHYVEFTKLASQSLSTSSLNSSMLKRVSAHMDSLLESSRSHTSGSQALNGAPNSSLFAHASHSSPLIGAPISRKNSTNSNQSSALNNSVYIPG